MKLKKFGDYILNENILDYDEYDDEIVNNWEVRIDDKTDSFWEYKQDAIERIVDIFETESEDITLEEYLIDNYDDMTKNEFVDVLYDMSEIDFYNELDNVKEFINYTSDIKLINISDEDELDFLEEE